MSRHRAQRHRGGTRGKLNPVAMLLLVVAAIVVGVVAGLGATDLLVAGTPSDSLPPLGNFG